MTGPGLRVLIASLLLAGSLTTPVVCIAHTHLEVEMPFAGCCGHLAAPEAPRGIAFEPSASGCGGCTDVPLISSAESPSTEQAASAPGSGVLAITPPAVVPDGSEPQEILAVPAPSPEASASLRC